MFRTAFSAFGFVFLTLFTLFPASAQPLPDRAPLHGLIVDQENKPIEGLFITVRRQNDMGSYSFWGGDAVTDTNGRWSIPDAEEGNYYVNVDAVRKGFSNRSNVGFAWKQNSPPFRVQLQRMVMLKLRFTNPDGSPVVNSSVYINLQTDTEGGRSQRNARTDANGNLTIGNFVPATYRFYASAAGGVYSNNNLQINSESVGEGINVPLQKGASLRAKIADANGRAIGGAIFSLTPVSVNRDATQAPMVGENVAILAAAGDASELSSHDGDGLIQLSNIPEGKYIARFIAPGLNPNGNETGAHAIRTVELKNGELTELTWTSIPKRYSTLVLDVTTPSGAKPTTFSEITVRVLAVAGNGSIFGNNEEGEGSFPGAGGIRRVTLDQNGRATLYPLRSGRYRIFVGAVNPNANTAVVNPRTRGSLREVGPLDVTISMGDTPAGGNGTATVVLDEIK
jgi:protocatechuate 3,4-dioxygenase beta subunit